MNKISELKQPVHFLHIGKTGGSVIKAALKNLNETPSYTINLHKHRVSLKDIPEGEKVFFFLRDPISRFISAFYSRQRKGQPRYYSEWTQEEKKVFEYFSTPNEIALALADRNSKGYHMSLIGMKSIQHFIPYSKWYINFDYFKSRQKDILFIGFQESLDDDFDKVKKILNIPSSIILSTDDIIAHKNPKGIDKKLDPVAISALSDWYFEDYKFITLVKEVMALSTLS